LDKLTPEQYARLLRAKGIAGKGNYTEQRRKWQDSLTDEDMERIDKELLQMAKERKDKD
jgi:hypothetical protein